jgi:hypothetical protein
LRPGAGADRERQPAEAGAEQDQLHGGAGELGGGDVVELGRSGDRQDPKPEHHTDEREGGEKRREALQGQPGPADRVGEQQLQGACLLVAGNRPAGGSPWSGRSWPCCRWRAPW